MSAKHLTWEIEAYLNQGLSPHQQQQVETHLKTCVTCRHQLGQAKQMGTQLSHVMQTGLGQPTLPTRLQSHIWRAIQGDAPVSPNQRWFSFFNPALALGMITLLIGGTFLLIQTQTVILSTPPPLAENQTVTPTPLPPTATPIPALPVDVTPLQTATVALLPTIAPPLTPVSTQSEASPVAPTAMPPATTPSATITLPAQGLPNPTNPPTATPATPTTLTSPEGLIAFSFYNPAAERQVYEIHLIEPDGRNHRLFPLDGVSEPALQRTETGYRLAYRNWGSISGPRALSQANLKGENEQQLSHFWEDAHPAWSFDGSRLVYASQREADRQWRLYTNQPDGKAETDLRLAGQSPTLSPDGSQVAYIGCDETGNQCGLWVATLETGTIPPPTQALLADPRLAAPAWSPTGQYIAYMANVEGNWDLYRLEIETGDIQRLTTAPTIEGLPTWSPTGDWLAFLSDRDGAWGIWLLHLESGETRRIFTFDGGTFTPPHEAPYSQRDWWDERLSWK